MSRKFLTVKFLTVLLALLLATTAVGCPPVEVVPPRQVSITTIWTGAELAAFEKTLAPFEQRTGIDVVVETIGRELPAVLVTRVMAGIPPDLTVMPNPGQMREFAAMGDLIPLNDIVDLGDHPKAFLDLGTFEGRIYGLFISADIKSLVWYSPRAFADAGYEIPTTWDELIALSEQIVADGKTPWALGMESGGATGWVGTDWIEDIMLRTAGPELYDKWVAHEIPWTHPAVRNAWELFGQIVLREDFVVGGTVGALTIPFGHSPAALFTDPPGAFMHRQATFIETFILEAHPYLVPGEDFSFFPLPPIDPDFGTPMMGAGDLITAFRDTPEVRELLNWLASAEAQEIWAVELGKLPVNKLVDPAVLPPLTAKAAALLAEADVFRFDASDLMPAAVGAGTFWWGVVDFVGGVPLDTVLETIEVSAIDAFAR